MSASNHDHWPENPAELAYHLDAVLNLFNVVHAGTQVDLLEELLNCVDWHSMFGGEAARLSAADIEELEKYYRAKFETLDRFYIAEQLSTQLMSALMVSGDIGFSDELQNLGRTNPGLWQEIRTFFSRKELATATAILADSPENR